MMNQIFPDAKALTRLIADEIYKALGVPKEIWWRWFFEPMVVRPSSAFAEICANFEDNVVKYGFREAAVQILPRFITNATVNGSENIPNKGPLLIVANHPGTYDSLVIAAILPRNDLKIIAGNIPFLKNLPATQNHIIHTTPDIHDRMMVLRVALRHLKLGGALLIFGSGGIDPEPAHMAGAGGGIDKWSPSLQFFMQKVPGLKTLITIVSDVLSPKFINHPLTIFRKNRQDKQRISEFLQVIQQTLSPGKLLLTPRVSFSDPVSTPDLLETKDTPHLLHSLKQKAKQLLAHHIIEGFNNP